MADRCFHFLATVAAAALLSASAQAQEDIVLDFTPVPQRTVVTTTHTESVQVVDVKGDAKMLDGYKAQGFTMPMRLTGTDFSVLRSRTGKRGDNGNLPVQIEIIEANSQLTDASGKTQKRRSALSDFIGARFNTQIRPGGASEYVSIERSRARPEEARQMADSLSGIYKTMEVLNGARMRVGETRQQKISFEMPVPGMQPLNFEGLTTYRLVSIAQGLASFQFDTDFAAMPSPAGTRVAATGKGRGELEFDLHKVLLRSSSSSTNLTIHIEMPDRVIGNGLRMKQRFTQTIEEASVTAAN